MPFQIKLDQADANLRSTVRAAQLATAFAKLDAIEGAAELPNDRLAALAETTSGIVRLWRQARRLPQLTPGGARRKEAEMD